MIPRIDDDDLPNVLTVQQVLASRYCQVRGLWYAGCPLVFLSWSPSADGTYNALIKRNNRAEGVKLEPTTWLEERP